jgi:hypothetical protein
MREVKSSRNQPLKCALSPREALRLAMLVKPPANWKKSKPAKKR